MKRFSLRLEDELHEKLRVESFITEKSMHEIVIELIEKHYKEKERLGMLKLVELNEDKRNELVEGTLEEIVKWLKENEEIYTWMLDEDPEIEMPDFDDVETLRELKYELNKVNLSWWSLVVENGIKL